MVRSSFGRFVGVQGVWGFVLLALVALGAGVVSAEPARAAARRGVVGGIDFGDAPDSYGTSLAANGARHVLDPFNSLLLLGSCADAENDARMPFDGTGDDADFGVPIGSCDTGDDEDGVVFSAAPFIACQDSQIGIIASLPGRLDAWIDWNRDGDFLDAGEQIATNLAVPAGPSALNVTVPCGTSAGPSYARFRISSAGGLGPTGPAPDGEVEDYTVTVEEVDFGDAPDSYGTSLASNGPTHGVAPGNTLYLGSCVDSEPGARTPFNGTGDDEAVGNLTTGVCATPGDDEDGVTIPPLVACEIADLTIVASFTERLDAWIDWNRDGDFNDFGEQIATRLTLVPGANTLSVPVPCTLSVGGSYARFRVSSNGVLGPDGPAAGGGEVEDYAVDLSSGVLAVPTLGETGLAVLATLLAAGAFFVLRRRRVRG